jgi:hypothetical protein
MCHCLHEEHKIQGTHEGENEVKSKNKVLIKTGNRCPDVELLPDSSSKPETF